MKRGLLFTAKLLLTRVLPRRLTALYWEQRCPVCGLEREWHEYGVHATNVYVDGMGVVPCESIKEG